MKRVRIFSTGEMKVNITSSIDVSQDESYFAAVTRYRSENSSMYDYQISTYGLNNLKHRNTTYIYSSYNQNTHPCKILSDGKTIIVVSLNHLIFYDQNLNLKNKILHNQIDVYDLQASLDSKLVAIIGNQKILVWDTSTYKEIIFPRVSFLTKKCKFSYDNQYFGVISQSSLTLYRIKQIGDTYTFDFVQTTETMGEQERLELLRLGSMNTFQFNPYDSMEVVIGFGNSSPRIYSFNTKQFKKVALEQQPYQMDNFKLVRYTPDGKRVISGDYLRGVGYWPGAPDRSLTYKQNYLLFGLKPYDGGRRLIGFVWEKIKFAQIQFECTVGNFSTSCQCGPTQYWDMSAQMCKPCLISENNNICLCGPNETFNPDVASCVYDCSKISKAIVNPYSKDKENRCYCQRGYTWKNSKCIFDCTEIFFSAQAGTQPESCVCNPGFVWNNIGKYCQCPTNSRLVINNQDIVSCSCLYNYIEDPTTGACKPDCTKIRYTNGTDENGDCKCNDGFVFQIYQNQSSIASEEVSTSKSILSAKSGACVRNCSSVNNTEGVKFFDQCQCSQNMVWDLDKCKLNCRKIKNGVALVVDNNGTESCTCTLNYHWVPFNRECGRNCDNLPYVNGSKYPTTLSCPCINNFNWNGEPLNTCVIDCQKINFTESYSLTSTSQCTCRRLFLWNTKDLSCTLNCSEIWDAVSIVGTDQCSCKENKKFNKTSMSCQVQESEVFNRPWVWSILGVFLLFVIIVAIVMIRFCWKFSRNDENKQHQKKLKKNTQPKLRKKKEGQAEGKAVTSERAELFKQ